MWLGCKCIVWFAHWSLQCECASCDLIIRYLHPGFPDASEENRVRRQRIWQRKNLHQDLFERKGETAMDFLPDKKHNAGGEETPPQYFKTLKLVSCYELNKVSLSNSLKILLKWCFFMTTNNANQSVEMSNISVPAWFIWFNRTHRDSNMNTSDWLTKKLSKFQPTEYFPHILVDVFLE